jgi:hypothetical protein
MRLSAPTKVIFWVATIVAILAVLSVVLAQAGIFTIPVIAHYAFWFLTIAYVLLTLGVTLKGI